MLVALLVVAWKPSHRDMELLLLGCGGRRGPLRCAADSRYVCSVFSVPHAERDDGKS
jgi:hypothetical protein